MRGLNTNTGDLKFKHSPPCSIRRGKTSTNSFRTPLYTVVDESALRSIQAISTEETMFIP